MVIEIAVAVVAVTFVVLVGFLIPALIELKKTVAESQRLIAHLDAEVPGLVKEIRMVTENLNAVTTEARDSVEHASALLHAVGEVGESVHQVHQAMRGKGTTFLVKLASMLAGVKAASHVLKQRVHKEGGNTDGQR